MVSIVKINVFGDKVIMREINLSEWVKAGEGYEADSYNNIKSNDVLLKLFKPYILKERIEDSYRTTNEILKMGISTPKAIEMVTCGDRIGVIYERINNKISLYRMFVNNHEKAKELGNIFGNAIKDFHTHKCDKTKSVSRYSVLKATSCGMISNSKAFTDEQKKEMLKKNEIFFEKFRDSENDDTLLVGDAHIGNVILANSKIYFIDLSSIQYGSPLLEIGWIYAGAFNERVDMIIPKEEVVPIKYKEIFWDEFIHTYYAGIDEKTINENIEKSKKYAAIQDLFLRIYINPKYEDIMQAYHNAFEELTK